MLSFVFRLSGKYRRHTGCLRLLASDATATTAALDQPSSATTSVPSEAFAVIIGGGVVGSSVAYHLAKRNIRDVVLLERGTLASGTTFRSVII